MPMSTLSLLFLLSLLPTGEAHEHVPGIENLSAEAKSMLKQFGNHVLAKADDALNMVSTAYAEEFVATIVRILTAKNQFTIYDKSKEMIPFGVFNYAIENGRMSIQMDPRKMANYINQIMSKANVEATKEAAAQATFSAFNAALVKAQQLKFNYILDANGQIGTAAEMAVAAAEKQDDPTTDIQQVAPCEKSLCKKDALAMCIADDFFTAPLFTQVSNRCKCLSVPPGISYGHVNASVAMEGCLTTLQNSNPVVSLKCADSVMEAARGIIEDKVGPLVCIFGDGACDGRLPRLLKCLEHKKNRAVFVGAIVDEGNECVSNIDQACVMTDRTEALKAFANCVLDKINTVCDNF